MKSLVISMNRAANKPNPDKLTIPSYWLCGGVAGTVNSLLAWPIEHVRIRMQIQSKSHSATKYSGSYDAIKSILRNHGAKGVFRGQTATMTRDALAFAIFFGTYEVFKEQVPVRNGKQSLAMLMALGSVSGVLLWVPTYPIDVVKTRLQADNLSSPKFKSTLDAVKQIYRDESLRGFTKGIVPWMFRAVFVLAATVGFYEKAHNIFVNMNI